MKKLVLVLVALSLFGCNDKMIESTNSDGHQVTSFKGSRYMRVDVDGVDCIVGAGNYDTTVAITCDWDNKQTKQF